MLLTMFPMRVSSLKTPTEIGELTDQGVSNVHFGNQLT
jgi:hypothetical protein